MNNQSTYAKYHNLIYPMSRIIAVHIYKINDRTCYDVIKNLCVFYDVPKDIYEFIKESEDNDTDYFFQENEGADEEWVKCVSTFLGNVHRKAIILSIESNDGKFYVNVALHKYLQDPSPYDVKQFELGLDFDTYNLEKHIDILQALQINIGRTVNIATTPQGTCIIEDLQMICTQNVSIKERGADHESTAEP